jgi:hypothetical protein
VTDTASLGKMLLIGGLIIATFGLLLMTASRIPFLGNLPGDIAIQRGNFSFFFPIVTCIVLSAVLTIVLNLFRR